MRSWKQRLEWCGSHGDVLLDLVRIYLGLALFWKGVYFVGHQDYLTALISDSGRYWIVPALVAHVVILTHIAGGILVAVGLATRLGAGIQIPVLLGAVFRVHLPKLAVVEQRQSAELSALVLFLLVIVFLQGGGPLSADRRMGRARRR